MDNIIESSKHEVKIIDRNIIYLSGIDKINNFDSKEFCLDSVLGNIIVKGDNLEIVKLDTHDGYVTIKGTISGYYYNDEKKKESESFFSKLLK